MFILRIILFILLYLELNGDNKCVEYLNKNNFQLIHDYVLWRNIKTAIIINDSFNKECDRNVFKEYLVCFSKTHIFTSVQSSNNFINRFKSVNTHKSLLVLFTDNNSNSTNDLMDQFAAISDTDLDYLIITSQNNEFFDEKKLNLKLNTDLLIAFQIDLPQNKMFEKLEEADFCTYNRSEFVNYENETISLFSNKIVNYSNCNINNTTLLSSYCLVQVYKIRCELSPSVITQALGLWNFINGTKNLLPFLQQEQRLNLHKFPLKFGQRNITQLTGTTDNVTEEDYSEEKLTEIVNYFEDFFNASIEIIYFQKFGYKETNGEWTDLLRAVFMEEIDLGLDRIIKTPERYNDMSFTHTILVSMRNIYIKPQESSELRDIFLVPFSTKLILCVVITGVVFSIIKFAVNNFYNYKKSTFGEAVIWCIGIFTMQGSVWTPKSLSGNIILITSLAFALVIYNSYSAFITSILSVEIANIRSIDDLLISNYNIGYIKNSQDEIYLRSMNDSHLQQIYLRGYLHNTVSNVTEGLLKSIEGHYGFFASVNVARKHLQIINNYRCNYDITEIPIVTTKNTIAFPLSKNSPYRKVINFGIIKMYENGIYKYIHSSLVPDLPKCDKKTVFRSADLPDLTSAFGILIIGIFISIGFLTGELLWSKKLKIWVAVKKMIFAK